MKHQQLQQKLRQEQQLQEKHQERQKQVEFQNRHVQEQREQQLQEHRQQGRSTPGINSQHTPPPEVLAPQSLEEKEKLLIPQQELLLLQKQDEKEKLLIPQQELILLQRQDELLLQLHKHQMEQEQLQRTRQPPEQQSIFENQVLEHQHQLELYAKKLLLQKPQQSEIIHQSDEIEPLKLVNPQQYEIFRQQEQEVEEQAEHEQLQEDYYEKQQGDSQYQLQQQDQQHEESTPNDHHSVTPEILPKTSESTNMLKPSNTIEPTLIIFSESEVPVQKQETGRGNLEVASALLSMRSENEEDAYEPSVTEILEIIQCNLVKEGQGHVSIALNSDGTLRIDDTDIDPKKHKISKGESSLLSEY